MVETVRGLVAAPFTPMHPDGSINLDAVGPYADLLHRNGLAGAFHLRNDGGGTLPDHTGASGPRRAVGRRDGRPAGVQTDRPRRAYQPGQVPHPGRARPGRRRLGNRRLGSDDVLERLTDLLIRRGVPAYLRSDNGSEFTARAVRRWLGRVGVRTLYIEPGSPWENGYIESFNGKLQDELLRREIFDTLWEAKVLVERWRREYTQVRPHSALGYRPPAPETREPLPPGSAALRLPAMAPQH